MGGRPPKLFFVLLVPLTIGWLDYNYCSKSLRGLECVMRIDPPHAGATTTFLFKKSTKIVIFSNFLQPAGM